MSIRARLLEAGDVALGDAAVGVADGEREQGEAGDERARARQPRLRSGG